MGKKIIFYGGVQGINKSERLDKAIEFAVSKKSSFSHERIKISDAFDKKIRDGKPSDLKDKKILWHEDDWKKYDADVSADLTKKIKTGDKTFIINNHFSVPYKGIRNYVPGLEPSSLEKLLIESFYDSKDKFLGESPCFGLLLVDPKPSLILKYWEKQYFESKIKNHVILHYAPEDMVQMDLLQNRSWANSYCNLAIEVLGRKNVRRATIYITKEDEIDDYEDISRKIAEFLLQF